MRIGRKNSDLYSSWLQWNGAVPNDAVEFKKYDFIYLVVLEQTDLYF